MADTHSVKILMTRFITHDVKQFVVSRPEGFTFEPGQGVELAIDAPGWADKGRPFTPTNLPEDDVLEFTIKGYADHEGGVTRKLHKLEAGAKLLMSNPFGTIKYQGPGVFIAGGAGITPFLAIFRQRAKTDDVDKNVLLFSNKTPADVICERELRHYLGEHCILTCTAEAGTGYLNRRIDKAVLAETIDRFDQHFYLCGPKKFMEAITAALKDLGARPQSLVFEK